MRFSVATPLYPPITTLSTPSVTVAPARRPTNRLLLTVALSNGVKLVVVSRPRATLLVPR